MFTAEQLLHPITPERPSGADLSFSPELDAISQARKFDDPSLDQGEWVSDLKEADWDFVVRRCSDLLEHNSKDLRLAVWLTEAAARTGHLRGLGEGFKLLAGLCEQYWDRGLYPEADDGDQEQRIGNLGWILSRTPALIREMALTEGRGSAYSTLDFDAARRRANAAGDNPSNGDGAGLPRLADLEAARRNNSAQFCASFTVDAQYCLDALLQLEQAADARLGQDSPGFSTAREAVRGMLHAMPSVKIPAQQAVADEHAAQSQAAPLAHDTDGGHASADVADVAADAPVRSGPPGAITNRAQAIAQLRAVAQFFRRTEPHSPVSYFADKAADAADQDLHTWLRSVVKDQGSLAHIEELLGVQPPA